ncbi:hypothetical protein ACIP5N_32145 [Streptomyces sp. NPDC088768]|uniref:hypothetical protein n=1 Tax=Streptomyces sp. NPDC088768 TaxID=3365894 RepID=UPI0037F528F3
MPVEPIPCAPGGGGDPGESCCAPSIASVPLCHEDDTPLLLVLRSNCACDGAEATPPEIAGWIDPATGVFTEGPAPADTRPCGATEDGCASVALLRLCDQTDDGACTPFLRRLVVDCDGETTAITDTALDGVTPYETAGTVIDCDNCPCGPKTKTLVLCDYLTDGPTPVTQFLRTVVYDCETGEALEQTDMALDGTTPYAPVGEVGECGQCRPTPMCPTLLGLSGPETWTMPEGTESLSLTVACGPVVFTDCRGNTTQINEPGASFTWAAPPVDCRPGRLCTPLTVDVPADSAVYLNFLTPCDMGDVS